MITYRLAQLINDNNIPKTPADDKTLRIILTSVFILLGAVSLLMVVIGGFRYILARGNPDTVKTARNTIVYSLVGLVLAVMAVTIVNVILGRTG